MTGFTNHHLIKSNSISKVYQQLKRNKIPSFVNDVVDYSGKDWVGVEIPSFDFMDSARITRDHSILDIFDTHIWLYISSDMKKWIMDICCEGKTISLDFIKDIDAKLDLRKKKQFERIFNLDFLTIEPSLKWGKALDLIKIINAPNMPTVDQDLHSMMKEWYEENGFSIMISEYDEHYLELQL